MIANQLSAELRELQLDDLWLEWMRRSRIGLADTTGQGEGQTAPMSRSVE
jgi:hypothetical protein